MANVEFKNVYKSFGKTEVVKNISLEIQDKEFLVLVGASGCGKSTLLRMIAGLEDITQGEILIDGKVVNNVHPKDRDIAMVFQNYALYPHMNVFDNMAFGLKMRKVSKDTIKEKVLEAAKILNLENLLERKPKELSGGQRQRVALGRAIVREPKVFLMDEPLSNLDAKLRVQMRAEIKKLHTKLQTTFVYVTHDQIEALTMGDRIAILNKGELQQVDTPENIYNKPANTFVAGFIGSPSTNIFDARVIDESSIAIGDFKFSTSEEIRKIIQFNELCGKDVLVGIRPEHFYKSENGLQIVPELIEKAGGEKLVHFSLNNTNYTVKFDSDTVFDENSPIYIDFDICKIHLFDKETQKRLIFS